ncbi:MAG: CRISPR-associated endoribonuclease Cas6, partial [Chlorobi bacterium]|nr:CRISPR-associated endoribonuclease Cas6 [Chlorobiota bacterium]
MRFKIELELLRQNSDNLLPLNYQYELSSWIYKVLNYGNPEFAKWLHSQGYGNNAKHFKLFTFSNLLIEKYKIHADRLKILSPKVTLYISFYPLEAITPFVTGLFNNQTVSIGDKISKVSFMVRSIEKNAEPVFTNGMSFRCLSPIIVSYKSTDKKYADYMYPKGENFIELFRNNLIQKFNVFYKEEIETNKIDFNME